MHLLTILFSGSLLLGIIGLISSFLGIKKSDYNEGDDQINMIKKYKKPGLEAEIKYPNIIVSDRKKFDKFIKEYDPLGDLKFKNINYRKGAIITAPFSIAEGFKYINKKTGNIWNEKDEIKFREMRWGYVRVHTGVDRADGGTAKNIKDVVMSPFNFNRSSIINYGNRIYGTLVSLWQDDYEFEFRIAHMNPKTDFVTWTLNRLLKRKSIEQNWYIGKAGNYGYSSGSHTHTEIKSYDEESEVLEILLEEKFGSKYLKEYSTSQILNFYRKQKNFEKASDKEILQDWSAIKKMKRIFFINKYLIRYIDFDGKPKTRYSTALLFNGL